MIYFGTQVQSIDFAFESPVINFKLSRCLVAFVFFIKEDFNSFNLPSDF
jgi:hypothetical protein